MNFWRFEIVLYSSDSDTDMLFGDERGAIASYGTVLDIGTQGHM
jgi:hypothetical protein